jgi:hypothetical protein
MRFRIEPDGEDLDLEPEAVVAAGYTGRDQRAVRAHVDELAIQGIDPPATVPAYYIVPPYLLTQDARIVTTHARTSGEAEFALLVGPQGVFVTAASDHTDREVERLDVQISKVCCPKVLGRSVWRLDDVRDRWDELVLIGRSGDDDPSAYQEARLGQLIGPDELLESVPWTVRPKSYVVLGGTVSATGGIRFERCFHVGLHDPSTGRTLDVTYETAVSRHIPVAGLLAESAVRVRAAAHGLGTSVSSDVAETLGGTLERLERGLA